MSKWEVEINYEILNSFQKQNQCTNRNKAWTTAFKIVWASAIFSKIAQISIV